MAIRRSQPPETPLRILILGGTEDMAPLADAIATRFGFSTTVEVLLDGIRVLPSQGAVQIRGLGFPKDEEAIAALVSSADIVIDALDPFAERSVRAYVSPYAKSMCRTSPIAVRSGIATRWIVGSRSALWTVR